METHSPWRLTLGMLGVLATASGCGTLPDPIVLGPVPDASELRSARRSARVATTHTALPLRTLSVSVAIELAQTANPDLRAMRTQAEIARRAIAVDPDIRDPELRLDVSDTESERFRSLMPTNETSEAVSVALRIYPRQPMLASRKRKARAAEFETQRAGLRAAERELAVDVAIAFARLRCLYRIKREREVLRDARRGETTAQNTLRSAGQGTVIDSARATLENLNAELDVQRTEERIREARIELNQLLGTDVGARTLSFDHLPDLSGLLGLGENTLVDMTRSRVGRDAVSARVERARHEWRAARSAFVPWISHLQARYTEGEGPGPETDEEWTFRAAVRVPLMSWMKSDAAQMHAAYDGEVAALIDYDRIGAASARARYGAASAAVTGWNSVVSQSGPALKQLEAMVNDLPDDQRNTLSGLRMRAVIAETREMLAKSLLRYDEALLALARELQVDIMGYIPPSR